MKLRERARRVWQEFSRQLKELDEACKRDDPHISSIAAVFLVSAAFVDALLTHGFDV